MLDRLRLMRVEALDAALAQHGPQSLVHTTDLGSELCFAGRKTTDGGDPGVG